MSTSKYPGRPPRLQEIYPNYECPLFFVTFNVFYRRQILATPQVHAAFCEYAKRGVEMRAVIVGRYVIMPTHLHAIFFHKNWDAENLQNALTDFRKFTGRSLCDFCDTHAPRCFRETFRAVASEDRERRFWQPTRHPEAVLTEKFWKQKFDYLHENPCRKGLVTRADHWRYSSAGFYLSDGRISGEVKISPIDWSF